MTCGIVVFIRLFSYGKRNQQCPGILTDRIKLQGRYDALLDAVYKRTYVHMADCAPRGWPSLSFLTEEERKLLMDTRPSVPPLKFICDFDAKLAQRLLYYIRNDFTVV